MEISRDASEALKVWLALGGVALLLLWTDLSRKRALAMLGALTLLASLNYARFSPKFVLKEIDSYDVLHYYISAKYFDQVGYFDLYPAILFADAEHEDGPFHPRLRQYRAETREDGYLGLRPVSEALRRGQVVRDRFDDERWGEFRRDVHHLMRDYNFTRGSFKTMMGDRGFNGTPVWLLLAEPIAQLVDVTWIKPLAFLDLLWLLVALACVRVVYKSWVPVLFVVLFLCLTYSLRWPVPGKVFLRYDWVALLLVTMALLRRGHPLIAGIAAALPALGRFFPAVWMFGPAVRGALRLFVPNKVAHPDQCSYLGGRVGRGHLLFAGAFLITALILQGGALARYGARAIEDHYTSIADHIEPDELSSRRMGLAIGMSYDGKKLPKYIQDEQKQRVEDQEGLRLLLSGFLLVGLGWGARRLRDDEAFALGFLPFFFLSTFSYYYAVARVTLVLFHAADLRLLRNRVGLAALLALELFSNHAETKFPEHRMFLIGHLSWGLLAYAVLMIGWLLYESHQERAAALPTQPTSSDDEEPSTDRKLARAE